MLPPKTKTDPKKSRAMCRGRIRAAASYGLFWLQDTQLPSQLLHFPPQRVHVLADVEGWKIMGAVGEGGGGRGLI